MIFVKELYLTIGSFSFFKEKKETNFVSGIPIEFL